jgi:hypothetical protein
VRKEDDLFDDILSFRGHRTPTTAVVANLGDPRDPGLKKAIARVRRTIRARGVGVIETRPWGTVQGRAGRSERHIRIAVDNLLGKVNLGPWMR